jgi:hypothetical protein
MKKDYRFQLKHQWHFKRTNRNIIQCCWSVLLLSSGISITMLAFLYSGIYPIGADDHHTQPVYWALQTLREQSIAREIKGIIVPALEDPQMLLSGGQDYNDMCSSCHLKPDTIQSDMSMGLYPKPPNLSLPNSQTPRDAQANAARQFWIIKHGIKASGMPPWGASHDDARIWSMVAFIQKMPTLSPEQYQILTAREDRSMPMDHAGM